MKRFIAAALSAAVALSAAAPAFAAQEATLRIDPAAVSHEVSDTLYGIFIEDISKAGDGGLVSNLVYNNSFEYNDTAEENAELNEAYWRFTNIGHTVSSDDAMNENNTHYEVLEVNGRGLVSNLGCVEHWDYKTYDPNEKLQEKADMGFKEGLDYDFSCYIKNIDFDGEISVYLDGDKNPQTAYQLDISNTGADWRKVETVLTSAATEDGALTIELNGSGTLYLDFVELIPQDSYGYGDSKWKYTTLRADLVDALQKLSPSFIRFPGGCFCEGDSLDNLFDWKKTIGPLEERKQSYNVWRNDDAGDYYINSNAMGYGEYFNLCEDLGAEPVPCLNAGLTCQGRNGFDINVDAREKLSMTDEEFRQYLIDVRGYSESDGDGIENRTNEVNALGYTSEADFDAYLETIALMPGTPEWQNYVQDILDLIEYANGDSTTTYWGAIRAANGHEEPYDLKYIGLGNENWGDVYWRNFDALYKAVKAAYPDITIITTSGTWLEGADFERAWETVNTSYRDCYVDEHYYTSGSYMYEINDRYDAYDRSGAKVFVGEYAATADGVGTIQTKSNMLEAVEEAAYMTGFERNSDIVAMTAYAPTFAKINSQNWTVNMVWFDSQRTVLTPAYFTQMLYSNNTGTKYVDASFSSDIPVSELAQSVTIDEEEQAIYVKLVNSSGSKRTVSIDASAFGSVNCASNQFISADYASACNEVDTDYFVAPQQQELSVSNGVISVDTGKYSVNVIRIAYGENDGSTLYRLPDDLPQQVSGYLPPALRVAIPCVICAVVAAAVAAVIGAKIVRKKKGTK